MERNEYEEWRAKMRSDEPPEACRAAVPPGRSSYSRQEAALARGAARRRRGGAGRLRSARHAALAVVRDATPSTSRSSTKSSSTRRGGGWFETSFVPYNFAGQHFEPILLVFVPAYWLGAGPYFLTVSQAGRRSAAAIPLYFFARALTMSPPSPSPL